MNHRRVATLAVVALAAFSSLATSPGLPPTPPTVDAEARGVVELTKASPIAVRELRVHVEGLVPNPGGRTPTAVFTTTAATAITGDMGGEIHVSVLPTESVLGSDPAIHYRYGQPDVHTGPSLPLSCRDTTCDARFAFMAEWLDPAADATAKLEWNVNGKVELWAGLPTGAAEPTVQVTALEPDANVELGLFAVEESSETVRLDASHRLSMWRVSMRLGEGALEKAPGWPLIVSARLTPTTTTVTRAAELGGREAQALPFIEAAPLDEGGIEPKTYDDQVEFEPFWSCLSGAECARDYIVGLTWDDVRQGSSGDAGWKLEVRAIGTDGATLPIDVAVEPVPPMPMAVASTSGTMVFNAERHESFHYEVNETGGDQASRDDQWDDLKLPTYAVWHVTARSTGSAPLPDDLKLNFGPPGESFQINVGSEQSAGFVPGRHRICRVDGCRLDDQLQAGFTSDGLPRGWEMTVDWTLEIGVGSTYPKGQTQLEIVGELRP